MNRVRARARQCSVRLRTRPTITTTIPISPQRLSEPREHLADAAVVLSELVRVIAGNVAEIPRVLDRRCGHSSPPFASSWGRARTRAPPDDHEHGHDHDSGIHWTLEQPLVGGIRFENATRISRSQAVQRKRAKPSARTPQVRNSRSSRSTKCGRPSPPARRRASARNVSRCSRTTWCRTGAGGARGFTHRGARQRSPAAYGPHRRWSPKARWTEPVSDCSGLAR